MSAALSFCPSNTPLPIQSTQPTHNLSTQTPKNILQSIPSPSNQFKEKILCLEIMGVDASKALTHNPSLQNVSLDSIHSIISYLQSKGIHQKDMGRIFGMCPKILTSNIKQELIPVFQFISNDLGIPSCNFRKVITKCPRLLACSVRDQLKPALFYLKRLGFHDFDALAYQDPILLVSSVENTLIPKLDYLISLGFSRDEVVGMILRCPGLFTFSIENNFKPKFGYFVEEMGGDLEELKEFPQYFAFSLEKRIKPRFIEISRNGIKVPLALMLKSTDEEFKQVIKGIKNG